jgi:hypothetical protein
VWVPHGLADWQRSWGQPDQAEAACQPVNPATVYGFRVHGPRAGGGLSYPAHEPNNEKNEQNCSEYATTDIHAILH